MGYVCGMADRALRGNSVYSIVQWLDEVGAPTPSAKGENWVYTTVERILRHPILAGMISHNPGNEGRKRGSDLLRGDDGLPVLDKSLAIVPVAEWRKMIRSLDERTPLSPSRELCGRRPRAYSAGCSCARTGR